MRFLLCMCFPFGILTTPLVADEGPWMPLMAKDLDAFKTPHGEWRGASIA